MCLKEHSAVCSVALADFQIMRHTSVSVPAPGQKLCLLTVFCAAQLHQKSALLQQHIIRCNSYVCKRSSFGSTPHGPSPSTSLAMALRFQPQLIHVAQSAAYGKNATLMAKIVPQGSAELMKKAGRCNSSHRDRESHLTKHDSFQQQPRQANMKSNRNMRGWFGICT